MTIRWKKNRNLKPAVILSRIEAIRTLSPAGQASFSSLELHDAMPALQSMLDFPPAADEMGRSTLIWKALSSISGKLTPDTFQIAVNATLAAANATKEGQYHILTSISLASQGLPTRIAIESTVLRLLKADYPKKYTGRQALIDEHRLSVQATAAGYSRIIATVKAKTPFGAATRALRALDIQRAVWCLIGNTRMEFVGQEWRPINTVRLGGVHTVHRVDGTPATDQVWFEPNYRKASIYQPNPIDGFRRVAAKMLRALSQCSYRSAITEALLRYVRALDESDQNNALIRLWGAIESLTSPGSAQYELVTRRCSFLFRDTEYHRQILEHLREYRNQSVHSGDQSSEAKAHCFQLQFYFLQLVRFHLGNARFFSNLEEANSFLDLPPNKTILIRQRQLIQMGIRFVSEPAPGLPKNI